MFSVFEPLLSLLIIILMKLEIVITIYELCNEHAWYA